MNFKDICRLKFGNIHHDTLVFYRSKTERTKRSKPIPIVVILTDELVRIIDKWCNNERRPDNYVFDVLKDDMTAQIERKTIQQLIKTTNKWLERIAKEVGILSKVTTYAARHSFSTVMKNGGAPIEYIKESLGHNSTLTTENYLNSYPDSMKRQFTEQLTVFKKVS
jgi:integrase/recombinase XerD